MQLHDLILKSFADAFGTCILRGGDCIHFLVASLLSSICSGESICRGLLLFLGLFVFLFSPTSSVRGKGNKDLDDDGQSFEAFDDDGGFAVLCLVSLGVGIIRACSSDMGGNSDGG